MVHQCGIGKIRKKIIVKAGTLSKLAWILETLEELIYVRMGTHQAGVEEH